MIRLISRIFSFFIGLAIVVAWWTALVGGYRFVRDAGTSGYEQAIEHPNTLTIVYRPNCKRCHKTLTKLFFMHAWDKGHEYVLNADKLTAEQLDNLESRKTPTFVYKGKGHNSVKWNKIQKIWHESHFS